MIASQIFVPIIELEKSGRELTESTRRSIFDRQFNWNFGRKFKRELLREASLMRTWIGD